MGLTIPSSWTHVRGMSASRSMTFDMDAGIASYVGAAGVGADWGAGREAAIAAAIEGAADIFWGMKGSQTVTFRGIWQYAVTGAESNDAHTRPGPGSLPSVGFGSGSAMSSESWKLFDLAEPVTCRNLKFADRLWSTGALCSSDRSPPSDTTVIDSCCVFMFQTGPSMCTIGGGQRKRFSVPYDFCATAACRQRTVVMGVSRAGFCETWSRTTRLILLCGSSASDASSLRFVEVLCGRAGARAQTSHFRVRARGER